MSVGEAQADEAQIREAEERGRRRQEVDGRLDEHDRRFTSINDSIERGARATEATNKELAVLKVGVGKVVSKLEVAEALSAAAAKTSVSKREFWLGVALVAATLLGPHIGGI